jgi:hypothetical protein
VDFLTASAGTVVFSAAIPGQPGRNHINCRWPSYWQSLFSEKGYLMQDVIRPKIIDDLSIPYWYRQNIFLYSRKVYGSSPLMIIPDDFYLVHKETAKELERPPLKRLIAMLLPSLFASIKRRTGQS